MSTKAANVTGPPAPSYGPKFWTCQAETYLRGKVVGCQFHKIRSGLYPGNTKSSCAAGIGGSTCKYHDTLTAQRKGPAGPAPLLTSNASASSTNTSTQLTSHLATSRQSGVSVKSFVSASEAQNNRSAGGVEVADAPAALRQFINNRLDPALARSEASALREVGVHWMENKAAVESGMVVLIVIWLAQAKGPKQILCPVNALQKASASEVKSFTLSQPIEDLLRKKDGEATSWEYYFPAFKSWVTLSTFDFAFKVKRPFKPIHSKRLDSTPDPVLGYLLIRHKSLEVQSCVSLDTHIATVHSRIDPPPLTNPRSELKVLPSPTPSSSYSTTGTPIRAPPQLCSVSLDASTPPPGSARRYLRATGDVNEEEDVVVVEPRTTDQMSAFAIISVILHPSHGLAAFPRDLG
ncbi:hypothetical protein P7C70_g3867, partial [Phenoliferia sp. Uapishka_3]